MVDWSMIKTLLIVLGPFLVPKGIAFFRSLRVQNGTPAPLTGPAKLLLNVLLVTALVALVSTLPFFQPENVVKATSSRLLQTSNDVLSRRLHNLRLQQGLGNITASDSVLLEQLNTRDGRLLYAAFGQRPLVECTWCHREDPSSYLYYAIPSIVLPHFVHTAVLGLVTSGLVLKEGKAWRTHATVAGLGLALVELFILWRTDLNLNTRMFKAEDTVWFYWRMLTIRGVSIAVVDAVLGFMIYLTATKRIEGVVPDTERIETTARLLEATLGAARAGTFMKGAVMEDGKLREQLGIYWTAESEELKKVLEEQESVDAKEGVENSIDLGKMVSDAEAYAEAVTKMIKLRKTFVAPNQTAA